MNNKSLLLVLVGISTSMLIGCNRIEDTLIYYEDYINSNLYVAGNREVTDYTAIKKIYLNWMTDKVDIVKDDSVTKISVEEFSENDIDAELQMMTYYADGELRVHFLSAGKHVTHNLVKSLKVTVPSSFEVEYLYCSTNTANVKCNADLVTAYFYSQSGNFDIEDSQMNYLFTKTSTGDLKLTTSYIEKSYLYTATGNYDVTYDSFYLIDINTEVGTANIKINNSSLSYIIDTEYMENPTVVLNVTNTKLENGNYLVGDASTENIIIANVINGTLIIS